MGITLHYLEKSRATRVVWLLEELGVPYQTKTYFRNPQTKLAGPELARVHPSGVSPLIEDNGVVYAESGNIVDYLINTYGKESSLIWKDSAEQATIKYAMYAAESNIAISGFMLGIHRIAATRAPWGLQTLISTFLGKVDSFYAKKEFHKNLTNLQAQIEKNGGWYCNGRLTVADIMYEVTLEQFFMLGMLKNLKDEYPGLYAWNQRIKNEPGYIKALEKQKELEKGH